MSARLNFFASDKVETITNFEVMEKLTQHLAEDQSKQPNNVKSVTTSTLDYLKTTPIANQTREKIANYIKALEQYDLTHTEAIQLLNFLPSSEVELHLLIEDCAGRLTEENIAALLSEIHEISSDSPEIEGAPLPQESSATSQETQAPMEGGGE